MPSWVQDLVMCACHVETHIYHKPLTCHVYFSLYAQLGTRPGYVCLPCRDSYLSQALDLPCISACMPSWVQDLVMCACHVETHLSQALDLPCTFQPVCPAGCRTWWCVHAMWTAFLYRVQPSPHC
ncbi:hypothetical protein DPMN_044000 [Dreissena polymorpha]|uniref:Uncharacterized protein n=1 Tax=Dreissena polymorpha TaxID=45954 RepID=A0A9D4HYH9_DREPO|nr:hypothetical protein DPMN_044000 [Dreissena polymorpha]